MVGLTQLGMLLPVLGVESTGITTSNKSSAANFSVGKFFDNLGSSSLGWAYAIIGILGVLAIIAGAYKLVTGLISHGSKPTSWPVVIILLIVGGIMTFGGWSMFAGTIAAGGAATVENWGTGTTILPMLGLM